LNGGEHADGAFTGLAASATLALDTFLCVGVRFMKRLVLCFDGTWNKVGDPKTVTNVVRIANTVSLNAPDGTPQVCYYNSGVGSGGPLDRLLGGAFGMGLKSNVKRGLAFLALNYRTGDEIYLFGFSRGAYTARALAGVLGVAGIPLDISQAEIHWDFYRRIAKLQSEQRNLDRDSPKRAALGEQIEGLRKQLKEHTNYEPEEINIVCVGVFDTVGAYGVPSGFGLGAIPHYFTYWTRGFQSRKIGQSIKVALHAMAIDERRRPFLPTFWTLRQNEKLLDAQYVEQMWFPGVHSNIGGGYDNCGLSDLALAWMISRVSEKTKLAFDEDELYRTIWPCPAGTLYRSGGRGLLAATRTVLPKLPDSLGAKAWRALRNWLAGKERKLGQRVNEYVHWSVRDRLRYQNTWVDGLGACKYEPRNVKGIDKYADPTELEAGLVDPARPGRKDEKRCAFHEAGLPCECEQYWQRVAATQTQPPMAA
jgi:uncharacterized protein (DUF2235 family)